ncbi:hypothetical protein [Methylomonas albis]|nr:hypothetical protein [Methylomonas albis]
MLKSCKMYPVLGAERLIPVPGTGQNPALYRICLVVRLAGYPWSASTHNHCRLLKSGYSDSKNILLKRSRPNAGFLYFANPE